MLIEVTRPQMEFVVASNFPGQWHVLYVWHRYKRAAPVYVAVGTVTKLTARYRAVRADYFTAAAFAKTYKYHAKAIRMLVAEAVFDLLEGPDAVASYTDYWYSKDDMHLFFRDSATKVDVAECCKDFDWGLW